MKLEAKRKQALDNKLKAEKDLEKANNRRQKSMSQQYEVYLKKKDEMERNRIRTMYLHDKQKKRSFDKHGLFDNDDVSSQSRQIEEKLKKAEEKKNSMIMEKIKNNSFHLERVEQKKLMHIQHTLNDLPENIPTFGTLTKKYKRSEKVEKGIEDLKQKLKQKREMKEYRVQQNLELK